MPSKRIKKTVSGHVPQRHLWQRKGETYTHPTARCCICEGPLTIRVVSGEVYDMGESMWDVRRYAVCHMCVRLWLCRAALARHCGDVRSYEGAGALPEKDWGEKWVGA